MATDNLAFGVVTGVVTAIVLKYERRGIAVDVLGVNEWNRALRPPRWAT